MLSKNEIRSLEKVKVIHYGIHKDRISSSRDLSTSKSILKIGTIARIVPQKDYPTLLRSFALVLIKLPNCTLSILGDGPELEKMKDLANSLGIQDKVVWCGKSEKVDDFLRNLDLFILTSVYEGFGLVLLEAMANRTPIIAADNSAIPEVIGKDSRYLFETGDFHELSEKIIENLSLNRRSELVRIQSSRLGMFDSSSMSGKVNLVYSQESPTLKL
jgi:glycosyltransferase involved in cell wall biosynthesis